MKLEAVQIVPPYGGNKRSATIGAVGQHILGRIVLGGEGVRKIHRGSGREIAEKSPAPRTGNTNRRAVSIASAESAVRTLAPTWRKARQTLAMLPAP